MAVNTYAFATQAENKTNIAERGAVYGSVANGSATDARCRSAALAAHEQAEIKRSQHENAGRMSAFWSRRIAPAAPPAA